MLMKRTGCFKTIFFSLLTLGAYLTASPAWADVLPAEINLSFPHEGSPLLISIRPEQSRQNGWLPSTKILIHAYTENSVGEKIFLRDKYGKDRWKLSLNPAGEGQVRIWPGRNNYTGRLIVTANGKKIYEGATGAADRDAPAIEKVLERRFPDGARIKVHFTDRLLEDTGAGDSFPKEALEAAAAAYQTITEFQGFSSKGYSFVDPDQSYAYDPDKTIDILLGDPSPQNIYLNHGFAFGSFRDAPCFDTVKVSDTAFHSFILLPGNYGDFIKNWERMNPSSLGRRNIGIDLRGTLMHEMLHVVVFYYNKNLNKESGEHAAAVPKMKVDWYVEGLARYFEVFAGARHDFYSQGFKQTLPDKIRFSRGGSNYFMRYPDQAFTELRYENALFWRYLDYQYGMEVIERLSRELRGDSADFQNSLENVTGMPMAELLQKFAASILFRNFGLKQDGIYLKEVARTRLIFGEKGFYLVDGHSGEESLGKICGTDWIGRWDNEAAALGELPVAGDGTPQSDVSGWATDYYEIVFDRNLERLPNLGLRSESKSLVMQFYLLSRDGAMVTAPSTGPQDPPACISLGELARSKGLAASDIEKAYLLVTNTQAAETAAYALYSS